MEPDFWHDRWRHGETGWHRDAVNPRLREWWPRLALAGGSRVFVPLCGKSLDLRWLSDLGHRVLGVELSRLAVESFFDGHGLAPEIVDEPPFVRFRAGALELLCGDLFELTPAQLADVDAVYDRGALVALPSAMRRRYAEHLDVVLPASAPRLLITLGYDQTRIDGPPFAIAADEVDTLFGARHRITRLADVDVTERSARLREQGVERVGEQVYRIDPA